VSRRVEHAARATRGLTFDTSVLIALEQRKAPALALLRACRLSRARITLPAPVVAEWWRGHHRDLLEIGELEPLSTQLALRAGELLAKTRGATTIDALVVASAAQRGDMIVTGDLGDLRALSHHVRNVTVEPIG
jgi:predicted nucleic acid-binding protein